MKRRQLLSTLSGLAVVALPVSLNLAGLATAAQGWTMLSSPPLKPGAARIRIPVDRGRAFMSGLRIGVDGNPLMVRKVLLHRGPRSLTVIEVNRALVPGREFEPDFPAYAPFLVRAVGVEYDAPAAGAAETVIRVWITG